MMNGLKSVSFRLEGIYSRESPYKVFGVVGTGRIKTVETFDMLCQREPVGLDALQDAFGHLVCSEWIEMGIVRKFSVLTDKAVCRIVHQQFF